MLEIMNETKQNIIIQALKYFSENDYDRASLNSIAEALNITKGAIYHYFKNKDGLFEAVINFTNDSIETFLSQTYPENPTVKDVIRTTLQYQDLSELMHKLWGIKIKFDYITFINLMFSGMKKFPYLVDKFKDSYASLASMVEAMIEKEKAQGLIKKDVDSRLVALELVTLSEGQILMSGFFTAEDNKKTKTLGDALWSRIKT